MNSRCGAPLATQDNLDLLRQRGVTLLGVTRRATRPAATSGRAACWKPPAIRDAVIEHFSHGPLAGVRAGGHRGGPTREPLDPVRVPDQSLVGKNGFCDRRGAGRWRAGAADRRARAAADTGRRRARRRRDRRADVQRRPWPRRGARTSSSAAAAVADYRPAKAAAHKIKKNAAKLRVTFERTPDILAAIRKSSRRCS